MTPPMLTPQEAARFYGKSLGYVYRLAHEHQWARLKWAGHVYYRQQDIDAVLGKDPGV